MAVPAGLLDSSGLTFATCAQHRAQPRGPAGPDTRNDMITTHRPINAHRGPTPATQYALALVAKGVSQRKAAADAGVSLAGLVKALKRERAGADPV